MEMWNIRQRIIKSNRCSAYKVGSRILPWWTPVFMGWTDHGITYGMIVHLHNELKNCIFKERI